MTEPAPLVQPAPSYVIAPSRWAMPHDVRGLALTPDGAFAWAFDFVGNVWLFDLATGAVARKLRTPTVPGGCALALDPTGTLLAFAPGNAPAELWNTETGEVRVLPSKLGAFSVGFSSDGARLIVGGARFVSCYELRPGGEPRFIRLKAHPAQAFSVALRDAGLYGVSLGYDGAKEHSILTGLATSEAFGLSGRARFDRGARFVFDSTPDTLLVRDFVKGHEHLRAPLPSDGGRKWTLRSVAPDASRAYLSDDHARRLLCVEVPAHAQRSGVHPACVELPLHWIAAQSVVPLPDGALLVAGSTSDAPHSGGVLAVLDPATGALVRGPEPGASRTTALRIAGDALWVASADRTLAERSLADGSLRGVAHVAGGSVDALYPDAAGAPVYARAGAPGGLARVLRVRDGGAVMAVPSTSAHAKRNAVHAPSGTFVGVGVDDRGLVALALEEPAHAERARFSCPVGDVHEVHVSADGSRCAVLGMDAARVFSLADGGEPIASFSPCARGHHEACALTRDGRLLVTPAARGQHVLWDTGTGRRVRALQAALGAPDKLIQTTATALDPTERYLATAMALTGPAEVWLWELATGKRLARLSLRDHGVATRVSLGEGCASVAAGTSTGALLVWSGVIRRPA